MFNRYPPSSWELEIVAVVLGFAAWVLTGSPTAGLVGALAGVLLFHRRYLASERAAHHRLEERLSRLEATGGGTK